MTTSRREGPFGAEITGDLLSAHRFQTDENVGADSLTGRGLTTLFVCSLQKKPWFVLHGDGLYAQNAQDGLAPLYRGDDAAQLLRCISDLLTTTESKRIRSRRLTKYGCVLAAACLTGALLTVAVMAFGLLSSSGSRLLTTVDARPVFNSVAGPARNTSAERSAPVLMPNQNDVQPDRPVLQPPAPREQPSAAAADGWDLPQSVRAELPAKLHNAASRGLFTVPLSSGHARTIYVFADPACPNCQRMERHFETAAGTVNVVIFPVTIEGREASLKTLTPLMALPEAERPAAWKQLFSADAGIGVPGATPTVPAITDETQAETARGAIGVNEVAFRAYRLPGTPWTISDDGRYVPQSVLSSPAALTDFLNGGDHGGQ
ncbi:thioredoxin fold domain-containing protein [Pantoea sp. DY-5]|nr:thioredoxin fold domain-containing protein [Pantoea sp. DY-5]